MLLSPISTNAIMEVFWKYIDTGLSGSIRRTEFHNWVHICKFNVEQCSIKRITYHRSVRINSDMLAGQKVRKSLVRVKLADIRNVSRIKPCCHYAAHENGSDQVLNNP